MKNHIGKYINDLSDFDRFLFSVSCPVCRKEWTSTPVPFSRAGKQSNNILTNLFIQKQYSKEKKNAEIIAAEEPGRRMNYCSVCMRFVCDSCYMICADMDMCTECAACHNETGERVAL